VVPGPAATARATPRTAPRRVSAPAAAPPHEETAPKPAPAPKAEPIAPARLAAASAPVTEIEHTIGTARQLDYAFAALPAAPDIEDSEPTFLKPSLHAGQVELPIVVKPDPVRASRFAPGPVRGPVRDGAYANAPAPRPGTQGRVPPAAVEGTVVETVSVRVKRDEIERPAAPPPIRHILPRPTASTIPPKEVEAARPSPEPEPVEVRTRTRPVPVPPLARELDDDPTAETPPPAEAETRAIPVAGSLLGEIGGLPRVEVRAARPTPVTDTAPNPERTAREAYELRARELERVAHERLMREQQRLAVDIREQLAHDKRELESVLDNRLEDTVLHPRA
jgi:hypothetical protein